MSVKNALGGLDILIEHKKKIKSVMQDLLYEWRNDSEDVVSRNAKMIVRFQQYDLDWLHAIKRQLLPEQHRTKIVCKHPKKDHDVCDGKKYCMNCNEELE